MPMVSSSFRFSATHGRTAKRAVLLVGGSDVQHHDADGIEIFANGFGIDLFPPC